MGTTVFTAMISSTALDLPTERNAARAACETERFLPLMMELEKLQLRSAEQESRELVDECDVYLLLLAHRYGSRPAARRPSFTEIEFRRARELGKPIVVLQIADECPVLPAHIDREPRQVASLRKFVALVQQEVGRVWRFRSAEHLGQLVGQALQDQRPQLERLRARPAASGELATAAHGAHDAVVDFDARVGQAGLTLTLREYAGAHALRGPP